MKTFLTVALFSLSGFFVGCNNGGGGASNNVVALGNDVIVTIQQGATGRGPAAYGSSPLTVKKGSRVSWVNADNMPHTATADDGSFDSGTLNANEGVFSHTFNATGTFPYHCTIHGAASMSGVLQVTD